MLPSPTLPLPVELVAGGDGRPEALEDVLGLGGSGRSGRAGELEPADPMKIADKGRDLEACTGRGVIGRS